MNRWLSARLQYLHCSYTGDTAVFHWAIDIITWSRYNGGWRSIKHSGVFIIMSILEKTGWVITYNVLMQVRGLWFLFCYYFNHPLQAFTKMPKHYMIFLVNCWKNVSMGLSILPMTMHGDWVRLSVSQEEPGDVINPCGAEARMILGNWVNTGLLMPWLLEPPGHQKP